jgi:integrase/recombinase XerD
VGQFRIAKSLRAFETDLDADKVVLALSTYVGHSHVADTYWYVTGVPELMAIACERFQNYSKVVL